MEGTVCGADVITRDPDFRLIETFGYQPGAGSVRKELHLARMQASAAHFGIPMDLSAVRARMDAIRSETALRCRMTLAADGTFELTTAELTANPAQWRVALAPQRLRSSDMWLRHKTSHRAFYNQARQDLPAGIDELLFFNERDALCEGSITNVFVRLAEHGWVTPPVSNGLLPGVLRQFKLQSGQVREREVGRSELLTALEVRVGNSLRGEIPALVVA